MGRLLSFGSWVEKVTSTNSGCFLLENGLSCEIPLNFA